MTRVLGIIIAYKHQEVVNKCVQHALDQDFNDIDWVVWNNGGIESALCPGIYMHNAESNMLWTPALNKAINLYLKPEHTHIFYMNHDIFMPRHTISVLLYQMRRYNAGAIAPTGSALGGLQDHVSHINTFKDQKTQRASYLVGAIQMMKREVWETVGPFDEQMPLGGDDFDYSIRMKEAGFGLWVTDEIYVQHIGHITSESSEWNDYGALSWDRFNQKYDGYYASEEEAFGSLWGSIYNEKYPIGTGISEEEKIRRGIKNAL